MGSGVPLPQRVQGRALALLACTCLHNPQSGWRAGFAVIWLDRADAEVAADFVDHFPDLTESEIEVEARVIEAFVEIGEEVFALGRFRAQLDHVFGAANDLLAGGGTVGFGAESGLVMLEFLLERRGQADGAGEAVKPAGQGGELLGHRFGRGVCLGQAARLVEGDAGEFHGHLGEFADALETLSGGGGWGGERCGHGPVRPRAAGNVS
jgi:hypothetical protein